MRHNQTTIIMKALADDMRIAIVRSLVKTNKPSRSSDVVAACSSCAELSQPAMSHHFKKLVDASVILVSKSGSENLYRLNRKLLLSVGINANKL